MLKEVEDGVPTGKFGQEQPHIRLLEFRSGQEVYCVQKETAYRKEGLKEFLLCEDCERRLGIGENYVRRVLYGRGPIKQHTCPARSTTRYVRRGGNLCKEGGEIRWVEYAPFKQFQLGVIWRACIAKGNAFRQATASAEIIERMRVSLYSESYDEHLAPCLMEQLDDPAGTFIGFIGLPKHHCSPNKVINMVMGGYVWNYFVEGNVHEEFALRSNGKLLIKVVDAWEFIAIP